VLIAVLVISVATVLVYSNTFDASFHFDDTSSIVQNKRLRDLSLLWPPSGSRYLGYLSFALNYRLGTLEVFGYHLTNVLIHLCNGILVFRLASITLRSPALRNAEAGPLVRRYLPLAAGLLFAVHPVATQAVTYIVQRFASLAAFFYLLSLMLYVEARLSVDSDRPSKARTAGLWCASVVAAAAAMQTKEISFTLPFVAAGYDLLFFRPRHRLVLLAPLAATALLIPFGLAFERGGLASALSEPNHLASETPDISRGVYLLTQSRVVVTYLRLLLLPIRQNLDYDFPLSYSLADPGVLLALAVLGALAAFAVLVLLQARNRNAAPGVLIFSGIAWFFVTLSVESSIIPIRDVIFEHRAYLPSAGAAIALGAAVLLGVERLRLRSSLTLQAGLALLMTAGPLGVAAYARNSVWKNDLTLWGDVVAKSPDKARPHSNLGTAYLGVGATREAVNEFLIALEIRPEYPEAHDGLGVAYASLGQVDDAIREYREAIRLAPHLAETHRGLGDAYQAKGLLDDALSEYREALRLDPELAEVHNNVGNTYQARGQIDDAVREYHEALRLAPGLAKAHISLGSSYQLKGRLNDAIGEYHEAIRLDPGLAEAHNNLGALYEGAREFDGAIREFREAIRLDPGRAEIHSNLGNAYLAMRLLDDAVREYREAIRIAPGLAVAHDNLGVAYEAKGQFSDATREHDEAIRVAPELDNRTRPTHHEPK